MPHSDDDFITRIQTALAMSPKQLANALHIPVGDVVDRFGRRAVMSNWVTDPFWLSLLDYVNNQIAGYLAVREELERKQRIDQREYHRRQAQIRDRK